jgi:hypothetical protein
MYHVHAGSALYKNFERIVELKNSSLKVLKL